MRKWVGAALIVALLAIVVLFLSIPPAGSAGKASSAAAIAGTSFGIYPSETADAGSGRVAVLRLFRFGTEEGEVSVFCSDMPIQKNMLVLQHASAPGVGRGLSDDVSRELAACGFSSRKADLEDAVSSQNAVIIAPTGATPAGLAEKTAELQENNDRVVVLESLEGRTVDGKGALSESVGKIGFETIPLEPGSNDDAARSSVRKAMFLPGAAMVRIPSPQGNFTVAIMVNSSQPYCRAVYIGARGGCRSADTGVLASAPGKLAGPQHALAGKEAVFEFELANGSEIGRRLRFFAASFAGQQEESRKEIAGGEIKGGFASRFSLNFSSGGAYVVRILDQFGRLHASAYVDVAGLSIELLQQQGNRYEFHMEFGGQPAEGAVEAWIDNGEHREYYASSGNVVVWAAPSAGSHVMHFEHKGLAASAIFVAEGGGLVETYLRLGVPAAIFLFAVYFLLRAGRRAKYTITFPHFADAQPKVIDATAAEIEDAWDRADAALGGHCLPASPEELASAYLKMRHEHEKTGISPHSMLLVLRKLAKGGKFSECSGSFIPSSKLGGFSPPELAALRLLHDLLLERGVAFVRSRKIPVERAELELVLFTGKKCALDRIGRKTRAIVFADRAGLENFESGLGDDLKEDVRIKLALGNGKILLVPASRQELEQIIL